jgi:hypothetical protein
MRLPILDSWPLAGTLLPPIVGEFVGDEGCNESFAPVAGLVEANRRGLGQRK